MLLRRIIYIVVVIAFVASSSFVYAGSQKECKSESWMQKKGAAIQAKLDRLVKELQLTEEQKQKVKEILTDTKEQTKKLLQEAKEKAKVLQTKSNDKIKALLTPEQKTKFDNICKKDEAKPVKDEE
jgi:Spy/CpxP family protein refolding chaperone